MSALFLYFFVAIIAVHFFYFIIVFGKFSFEKPIPSKYTQPPVSVIVYAKNNQDKIVTLLPKLIEQNYPNFEIVLINNSSDDDAVAVFEKFVKQNALIKLVNVVQNEQFWDNKKYALTLGIKAASNDYLLFIDNNCLPASRNWIATMSSHFDTEKSIILSHNKIAKQAGFLNALIRFDNFFKSLQLFAWAKNGKPFSGSNKNIAYTKEVFFSVKGFVNHIKVKKGEAALFVNEAATSKNTEISINKESFTIEDVAQNFTQWATEKEKESTVYKNFRLKDKLRLLLFSFSQLLFIILSIALLILQIQSELVIGLIVLRYIFVGISLSKAAIKLDEKGFLMWFPIFEMILVFLQLSYVHHLIFTKKKN
jgi:glycosyltransferase involved in cell wall biosynthesis